MMARQSDGGPVAAARQFPSSPLSLPEAGFWLLCGALAIAGFAPLGWWPVQIFSLALLFGRTLHAGQDSLKSHALRGLAYGLGWTVCGMYWLYITMHHYGQMPLWLSLLAVFVLGITYLGPFAALALWSAVWLRRRWRLGPASTALLVLPATWALTEWTRGWLLTGLPWVVSGYAHTDSPLAGFAPLVGVYGIGALVALAAGALALVGLQGLAWRAARGVPLAAPDSHAFNQRLLATALAVLVVLPAVGSGLRHINWGTPHGKPITVRLLQGNVSQEAKFNRDRLGYSFDLYQRLITSAPADLIATPETALPTFIQQLPPDYLLKLQQYADASRSHLAVGLLVADSQTEYANSMIGISPGQSSSSQATSQPKRLYRYDKTHLVPFGEFVPFGFRWFVDLLGIPMADQTPGRAWQKPWQVADQWVLPNICYEDLFGEEIAHQMAQSHKAGEPVPSILLNMSNLAWFDDSLALPQHLQIARMRVLELARPMLRATNTGVTAIIEPGGKVVQQLPNLQPGELRAQVQGFQGMTPYAQFGNRILLLLAGLALLAARSLRSPAN